MAFDPTTQEYGQWSFRMPSDYDGGQIWAKFASFLTGSGTGGIVWSIQGRALGDGESIDQAWGTARSVADTHAAANTMYLSAEATGITLAGTPAAEEVINLRVFREVGAAGDTATSDAQLHSVKLRFGRT